MAQRFSRPTFLPSFNDERRRALRAGAGAALGGLIARALGGGIAGARAATAASDVEPSDVNPKPARACVLLYMAGGPSHIDTFDPKPGSASAGDIKGAATSVSGVRISEHLPGLARRMNELALVRSLSTKEGNHDRARHLMHTGYVPQGGARHPGFGALVADARAVSSGPGRGLPGYVSIAGPGQDAGFLSAACAPFPVREPTKPVRYLAPPKDVDSARFDERLALWRSLEQRFARAHVSAYAEGQRAVGEEAVALMRSSGASAFALDDEPPAMRERYGASEFGAGCLMARRLIEAGVPFVEITLNGWDTHDNNFPRVRALSATLDQGFSALLDDLGARGLLASTLMVWMGDFGRTPRINEKGGRDHHPEASTIVLAGGGVRGGQVYGATDADGAEVRDRPVSVPDLYRTIAYVMGLDPDKMRTAPSGRPIKTVDGGQVLRALV